MTDTEPRATPADIAEVTRYATESRPPAEAEIPDRVLQTLAHQLHDWLCGWNCQGHGILNELQQEKYRRIAEIAVDVLGPSLIQAGREQATAGGRVALRELEEVTACHCGPAWTDRGLHSTHCLAYLRGEVEALYRAGVQAGREAAALAIEAVQPGGDDEYRLTAAKWRHAFATVARGGNVPQDTQPSDLDALIRDLVAITSCWPYPDGGGCQAHKWVEDEPCPHRRAREYLAQRDAQDGGTDG